MYLRTNTRKGFSVIELVIYVGLLGMFSVFVIDMIFAVLTSFGKARIERNLSQQATAALERMVREVRLADSVVIVSSVLDTHPGDLKVNTVISPTDTTPITRRFFIQSGNLMLQEGLGTPVALTSGVTITNLVFHKAWQPSTFYYVRGAYGGCSDGNSGLTPATAFCTISKAASVATAGSVVFVGPAMYIETVTMSNSGTAGNPIYYFADKNGTYTTDAPGAVTVDGNIYGFVFPNSSGGGAETGKDYIIIDGFTIVGTLDGAIRSGHGSDYNVIRNNVITGNDKGIILTSNWGNGSYAPSTNWIIENNNIYGNTYDGISFAGGRFTNTIVQDNKIHNNDRGIVAGDGGNSGFEPANNVTIRHNKIYNNTRTGILGHVWFDGLFFNNTVYGNGGDGMYTPFRSNSSPQVVTVRNNTFYGNSGRGLAFGQWDRSGLNGASTIENNLLTNNAGIGFYTGISACAVFRNNDVWSNGTNYGGNCADQTGVSGNLSTNPLLVSPPTDFHLQSLATGHGADSPAINTGYNTAAAMGLSNLSTLTNNAPDTGTSDMGYHYGTVTSANPLFFLGNLRADAVRIEITVQGGSGKTQSTQNFYATAVLRRSY